MCSHYLPFSAIALAALFVLPGIAPAQSAPGSTAISTLFPGGGVAPPPDPHGALYDHNPKAVADGARLFDWYNCSGCHFHGGGGIGPALMDDVWIYGGSIDQIFSSIYQGRPNGMPSWARKIPENEMWEIAAYVRSLSTPSAANGPGQLTPQTPPPPAATPAEPMPQTGGSDGNR